MAAVAPGMDSVPFAFQANARKTVRKIDPAGAHHAREAAKHRAFAKAKAIVAVRTQSQHLARSGSDFAARKEKEARAKTRREADQQRKLRATQAEAEALMAPTEEHIKSEAKARWTRVNNLLKVAGDMPLTRPMAPPDPVHMSLGFLAMEGLDAWPKPEDCEPSESEDEDEVHAAGGLTKKEHEHAARAKEESKAEPGTVEAALEALTEQLVDNDGGVGVEAANYTRQFLLIEAAADRKRRRRRAEAGMNKPRVPPMGGGIAEAAAAQRARKAAENRRPTRVDFFTGKRVPIPQSKLEKPVKCGTAHIIGQLPTSGGPERETPEAARRKAEAAFEVAKKAEKTFAKGTRLPGDAKTVTAEQLWKKYVAMSEDSVATRAAKDASKAVDRDEGHGGGSNEEPATANLWALLRGRIDAGMPLPPFEPPPPEPEWYPYRVRMADEAMARERGRAYGDLMDKDGPRDPDNIKEPKKAPKPTKEDAAAAELLEIRAEAKLAQDETASLAEQLAEAERQQRALVSASLAGAARSQVAQLEASLQQTAVENEAINATLEALQAADDQAFLADPEVQWEAALRYANGGEDSPRGLDIAGPDYYAEDGTPYYEDEEWTEEEELEAPPEPEPWIYKEIVTEGEAVWEPRWMDQQAVEPQLEHYAEMEQRLDALDRDAERERLSNEVWHPELSEHGAQVQGMPGELLRMERPVEISGKTTLREQLAAVDRELARRAQGGDAEALRVEELAAPAAPLVGEWGDEWQNSEVSSPVVAPPGATEQAMRNERQARTEARERKAREREERLMRAQHGNGWGGDG